MEAPAKIVFLKLNQPLAQIPELAKEFARFKGVVRIPESVFVIRTALPADELCDQLSAMIQNRGSIFVAGLCGPCKVAGSDVSLNQVMGLVADESVSQ